MISREQLKADQYDALEAACREAGCRRRQTQVILGIARGCTDAELASELKISEQCVSEAFWRATDLLRQRFVDTRGILMGGRQFYECLRNKRNTKPAAEAGPPKAQAFGMSPGDLRWGRRTSAAGVLMELACRIMTLDVPASVPVRAAEVTPKSEAIQHRISEAERVGSEWRQLCLRGNRRSIALQPSR
ncbi:MAG TPA: hypothetical protein VK689_08460 [Armatimonadota bacterium]|nr:hypothetical protein [Armatimonadota bacterium]